MVNKEGMPQNGVVDRREFRGHVTRRPRGAGMVVGPLLPIARHFSGSMFNEPRNLSHTELPGAKRFRVSVAYALEYHVIHAKICQAPLYCGLCGA